MLRLAILISGNGSNLQAIIDAIASGLAAEIAVVISDKDDAYGLERAKRAGISTKVITRQQYPQRAQYDAALQAALEEFQPDYIILAGFMRILGPEFVTHFANRILNIHPSLLPKYPGLNTHQAALAAQDKYHGVTVHVVTAELDSGPIIAQASLEVATGEDATSLQGRVHQLEHRLYPWVISLLAAKRLQLTSTAILLDDRPIAKHGLNMDSDRL